jgi:D-3-phosphoglycerate dehydrogenase / 2-oxoglutarate reductase
METDKGRFTVALVAIDAPEVPRWVWDLMSAEGIRLVAHDCTSPEEFLEYARNASLVWVLGGNGFVSAKSLAPLLGKLPECGAILRSGSGTDNVPVEEATRLGIVVANTPEATSDIVAEHAIALLFAVVRQTSLHDRMIHGGRWDRSQGWPKWHLSGRTLGLVGFGHVGRTVARKMAGFGVTVLVHDPFLSSEELAESGVRHATFEDLLTQADFISLHCPLTPATYHKIGTQELRRMKPTAILINTSRGTVVDEVALTRALREGWIAAAGLDVLEQEPPSSENPLLSLPNVVLTPHIAALSDLYFESVWRDSVDVILSLAHGRWPRWYVNRDVKPRWVLRENS